MVRSTRVLTTLLALAACEQRDPLYCGRHGDDPRCAFGGGGDGGIPEGYYIISGTVTGLNGSGLVLVNNGSDDKQIISAGAFSFSMPVMMGTTYDVTVGTQPTNPSETCTVMNGSGTATSDVMNVAVTCTPTTYSVGGTVVGLSAGSVVLSNNGGDDTAPITTNGPFTFTTPLASGAMYNVTVKTQTGGGSACTPVANSGTVGSGPVKTVVINCSNSLFTIGGSVSGLNGSVKLTNNGADQITVSNNGSFAFPTLMSSGAMYLVAVATQPAYPPAAQTCTVTNQMGTVNGPVVTVSVTCSTRSFTVGGNVTGLTSGTVVLKNGADTQSISANGAFTFPTAIQSGMTYAVTVMSQPTGLKCTVGSGTGTIGNANVTNVSVTCADPGTKCGGSYCAAGQQCCDPGGSPSCAGSCSSSVVAMACDDKAGCSSGNICCATRHNGNANLQAVTCESSCSNVNNPIQLCNPIVANECASGSCQPWSQLSGYYVCR